MILERDQLEQVQLYVATAAPAIDDPDRYSVHLLNTLLGGGVSSRLFQAIREERGLAYSVYSSVASYSDCGYLMVSAGTRPVNAATVVELIVEELGTLRAEPITAEELDRMKDHLKGGLMLSLENTFGRMANLARQQMGFDRTFSLDEILAGIDAVTIESVQTAAERLFGPEGALSLGLIARRDVAEDLRAALERHGLSGHPARPTSA
jgi:predicted Zn-dependent peptidase